MQNSANSESMDRTVTVGIGEHSFAGKPQHGVLPTFDRHRVFLPENPTTDADGSACKTGQESDPFTAVPSRANEGVPEAMSDQLSDPKSVVVKQEPVDSEDSQDTTISNHPVEDKSIEQEPPSTGETNFLHIEIKSEPHFEVCSEDEPPTEPNEDIVPIPPTTDFFTCNLCPFKTDYMQSLVEHSHCHIVSLNVPDHVTFQRTQPNEQLHACEICSYTCTIRSRLLRHMLRHTTEKRHACSQCNFKTHNKKSLKNHLHRHSGELPFACDRCSYKTNTLGSLNTHKLRHNTEKRFSCGQCEFKSHTKFSLDNHMRRHSGDRPFVCDVCELKFTNKYQLKLHKMIHSSDKSYKCDKCSYSSNIKGYLTNHKLIHQEDKSYICSVCGYGTHKKFALLTHLRTHSGEQPFACEICPYKSARLSDLRMHIKRRHK